MTQILVVEDDADLRLTLRQALTAAGYAVDTAADGQAALAAVSGRSYALMVLDLGLPQVDGLDVLRRLRAGDNSLPVLVLTARDGLEHRVLGLKLGADDYLAKPFELEELEARAAALIRRASGGQQALINGPLHVYPGQRVQMRGVPFALPKRELDVLAALMQRPGHVVQKARLAAALGNDRNGGVGDNAVEVYVHRLRRKLESEGFVIRTVHGIGYVLEPFGGY
jgi:DNA-binding response OmpR family regulator